ncbi:MAG: caspase domain-containing protein [Planctomycetota bacterium]
MLVPLLVLLAGPSQEPVLPSRPPVRRALLVGVGAYPGNVEWPALTGPPSDVRILKETLVAKAGFEAGRVQVLINDAATHEGILRAFRGMAAASGPEDLLLFFFAGHGSYLPDDDGDESFDGYDETIVPFDARGADGGRNDIRDDEIRELIELANRETRHVVLLFDCCNSGTNARGGPREAGVRRVPGVRGIAGTRASPPPSGPGSGFVPLSSSLDYVSLSACRADQNAAEMELGEGDAGEVHGLFTWCLVRELRRARPGLTWLDLGDRVRGEVRALHPAQTPVLEGNHLLETVLPVRSSRARASFLLEEEASGLLLRGGALDRLRRGTILSVLPEAALEDKEEARLGRIELLRVGADSSQARWLLDPPALAGEGAAPRRFRTFELERPPAETRLRVSLAAPSREDLSAGLLREKLAHASTLELSEPSRAMFHLALTRDGESWGVTGALGRVLPLEASRSSPAALDALVAALEALSGVHAMAAVRNEESPLLAVRSGLLRFADEEGRKSLGPPERDPAGMAFLENGDLVAAWIRNESRVSLFATLLDLSPDGQIQVLYSTAEDEPLRPGEERRSPLLRMTIPEGNEAFFRTGPETFRWVVTLRPQKGIRRLEQEPVRAGRVSRGIGGVREGILAGTEPIPLDSWATSTLEVKLRP